MYAISIVGYANAEECGAWPLFVKLGKELPNIVTSPFAIIKNIGDANK